MTAPARIKYIHLTGQSVYLVDEATLINLDCFAISVKFSINFEGIEDIQNLFAAYLD